MIYYIEDDGRTVTKHAFCARANDGALMTDDGRMLDLARVFCAPVDTNPYITKTDTGRYVYTSPVTGESIVF